MIQSSLDHRTAAIIIFQIKNFIWLRSWILLRIHREKPFSKWNNRTTDITNTKYIYEIIVELVLLIQFIRKLVAVECRTHDVNIDIKQCTFLFLQRAFYCQFSLFIKIFRSPSRRLHMFTLSQFVSFSLSFTYSLSAALYFIQTCIKCKPHELWSGHKFWGTCSF